MSDKQNVIAGLAFSIFSLFAASYLLQRHRLAPRVIITHSPSMTPYPIDASTRSLLPPEDENPQASLTSDRLVPNDVLTEFYEHLNYDPRLQLVSKQWRDVFQDRAFYSKLFQSYQRSPYLLSLCDVIQAQPHLTDKRRVQALYQAVIDLTLRTEGGEVKKQETVHLYSHTLSAERLNYLVCWAQAVNLIKVFEKISLNLPQAQTFLTGIAEKDTLVKAEDIRLWISHHTADLAGITPQFK